VPQEKTEPARDVPKAEKPSPATGNSAVVTKTDPQPAWNQYYYVQCGAFQDKASAKSGLAKLKEKNSMSTGIIEEGGYFKVLSGPWKSWKEAESHRMAIQNEGINCFTRKSPDRLF
jgi:cell division protein FtsN